MEQQLLNKLPEMLRKGELNDKQAIDKICSFVAENYPIYGLHKYDEDFKQDVLLTLLERGSHILHLFNPDFGDFFTFLYCYICTVINTKIKSRMMHSMKDRLSIEESIGTFDEKEIQYHKIDYHSLEVPKIPYAPKQIPAEELQKTMRELTLKKQDKQILILALKSSYYITDEQIERICSMYNIKPEYFYNMIQHCKDSLENKTKRREKAQERRNFAYYHHKRYNRIIQNLIDDDMTDSKLILQQDYSNKEKKHRQNWKKLNVAFENGFLYLRPTNKTVANIMGICERQVNYYIKCAKKKYEEEEDSPEDSEAAETSEDSEAAETSENSEASENPSEASENPSDDSTDGTSEKPSSESKTS